MLCEESQHLRATIGKNEPAHHAPLREQLMRRYGEALELGDVG